MKRIFTKEESEVVKFRIPERTSYIMIAPSKTDTRQFTMGITEVPPGGGIPDHTHENEEEIMFCFEGEGTITIEGKTYPFKKGVTAYVPVGGHHSFSNPNKEKLAFTFTYSPPGYENIMRERAKAQEALQKK